MKVPGWFHEVVEGGHGLAIQKDEVLLDKQTEFQHIEIFENRGFGRVMVLDGCMMLTERDEFTYHEMLVHPGLLAHPEPRRVLVIGGGDGGTLREILKHPEVEEAVLCEIDGEVIEASRKYLPFTAVGLDDPRATIHVGDGIQYLKDNRESFDLVIIDSTDPVGFAEGLFKADFYRDAKDALREGGFMIQQTESPFFDAKVFQGIFSELRKVFGKVWCYGAAIPMYPSGYWTFGIASASEDNDPWINFESERAEELPDLKYYTQNLQYSAFDLPLFAKKLIAGKRK